MARELRDGELERIVRSTNDKLVCVDFGNPTCPPCIRAKPIWNQMAGKYNTCAFYSVECQSCPGTASQYGIRATPTFMFFLKGNKVGEVQGFDQNKIVSIIEKYKTSGAFSGQGRTLGDSPSPSGDYFAMLQAQANMPRKQVEQPQQKSTPNQCCEGGVCKIPQKAPAFDPELKQMLLDMQFPENIAEAAMKATNNGSIDDCVCWIAEHQDEVERLQNLPKPVESIPERHAVLDSAAPPAAPAYTAPIEQPKQECKSEQLSPAAESMKNDLLEFGFEESLVLQAIDYCDAESIDKALDYINKVQNGEPIPPKKKRLSEQEAKDFVAQMRAKAKAAEEAKNSPEARAKAEMERRKNLAEEQARREALEERKREQERREIEQQRLKDKIELERVKAKIRQQRAEAAGKQAEQIQQTQAAQQPVQPRAAPTEATIQFVFPDNTRKVMKFGLEDSISEVERKLKQEMPILSSKVLTFETIIPRAAIPRADYKKTLTELHLVPRSQLSVKY